MEKFDLTMDSNVDEWNGERHLFSVADFELLVAKDIRVTRISALHLDSCNSDIRVGRFLPTFKKFKYLEEFDLAGFFADIRDMENMVILPIETISSSLLDIENGKVHEVVRAISKVKSLKRVEVCEHWTEHPLSPEEFALFKDLPVKKVELEALDLKTEGNMLVFRKIMLQMKIEEIITHCVSNCVKHIRIIDHGPGGIYKTL